MNQKPKVLFYANYYMPDKSAMARLMTDLAEGIADEFEVNVVCAVPSYAGKVQKKDQKKRFFYDHVGNVNIIRVRVKENDKTSKIRRIRHVLDYFFNAILASLKVGKCDLVYATTAPPVLGGLLGRIGKFITKAKYIYVIQDFNPEQIEAISYSNNKFLISILRYLDYGSCRAANKLVVIGRDMQETLNLRFGKNKLIGHYIHNWVDEKEMHPLPVFSEGVQNFKKKYSLDEKLIFMYLGNLGLYYDLLELLKIIEKFNNIINVVFVFVGTGAVEEKMKQFSREKRLSNIRFIPYQSGDGLLYAMNAADVHIVTNAKGIKGISVPSKIYGIMAVNKPILGILERDSEAWQVISETGVGVLCEAGEYRQIEHCIRYIIENKDSIINMGINSRNMLLEKYSKQDAITKYKALFTSLSAEGINP